MNNRRQTVSNISGLLDQLLLILSLLLTAFVLFTSATSPLSPMLQRSLVLMFMVFIIILLKPLRGKIGRIIDVIMFIGAAVSLGYIVVNWKGLAYRITYVPLLTEVVFGSILILILLELSRRTIGYPLLIIAGLSILYTRFGQFMPSSIAHRGYSFSRIISSQYITNVGIFGTMTGTLSTIIAPFVLFGTVLQSVGVGDLMVDTARIVSKNSRGGAAKMSVIASGLFGMVSGSSSSNVMTTGCTTIPLMKGSGYKANFAGAVEAVASTGGQFMPPVMGVTAFLMSYVTGIPYITIAIAAIIPAFFYFAAVLLEVDFEARKLDLKSMTGKIDRTLVRSVLSKSYFLIPFILLVVLLLQNWSAAKAAFYATATTLALGSLQKKSRISWKLIKYIALNFTKSMTTVTMSCAVAGIVIGSLNLTGATLRLTYAFVALAAGRVFILMILVAFLCIILGMGLPTPAAYSVAAAFAAPALTQVGISVIASHLFVLFYASLSSITPPVAIAAYAAAGLSGGSPMKTGWTAWRLGLVGFVIPFMFVYGPALLIGEAGVSETLLSVATGLVGIFFMAMATIGYFFEKISLLERLLLLIPSCLLIYSGGYSDIVGILLGLIIFLVHVYKYRHQKIKNSQVSNNQSELKGDSRWE